MKAFFRWKPKTKKEKVDLTAPQNEYYENVSANLGILQVILYLSLFAFVILSFFRNTNLITYRNFYYFFKDLNASAETVDVMDTDSVTYSTDSSQSFTLYRKGLAVAGNNSVTAFTATGRQTLSQIIHYQNPTAVGSGKYLLVYELGGTRYSLYNSYTQLYEGVSDYPILGAAVSDSGMFALTSSSQSYTSVVSLYSDRFALINRYNKNGYVTDVAINENGTLLAISNTVPEQGFFKTELELYKPGQASLSAKAELGASTVLSCEFTDSGMVGVLCADAVYYVTQKGTVETYFSFEGRKVVDAELGEDGVSLCLSSSSVLRKNNIIVFDKNGKVLYNEAVSESVEEIARSGRSVFLLTIDGVCRLDTGSGALETLSYHTEQRILLAVNESEVLLCSPQKAQYIRF